MNHIARSFTAPDGHSYKCHAWELREGGYRKTALLLGYPLWPVAREKRLIGFLLERGFLVRALELGFGAAERPRAILASLRAAAAAFARELASSGMPLYVIASSFSAGAVLPALREMPGIAAAALVAPVLAFPPAGLAWPKFPFLSKVELPLGNEELSGQPGLLSEFRAGGSSVLRFHKRDMRQLAAESSSGAFASALQALGAASHLAVFAGEEDPFFPAALRGSLAEAGVKLYAYPRVRHAPAYDRYADNYYTDLGSFLDGVEAKSRRAKTGGAFQ